VKQKGSSDIEGSLWNHLDKKVILWHREAPLFLTSVFGWVVSICSTFLYLVVLCAFAAPAVKLMKMFS